MHEQLDKSIILVYNNRKIWLHLCGDKSFLLCS